MPYGGPPYQQAPTGPQAPHDGHQPPHPPQRPYQSMLHPPALRPGIIPLRPLGLGDILDGTIKLIRSNPKAVLGLSAVAALLTSVPLGVGQALIMDSSRAAIEDPVRASNAEFEAMVGTFGATLVSYAVQFIAVTLLTGVLTRILGRAVFGGNITAGEAWQLSKSRVPALFGVVGLMTLIMIIPVVVFAVLVIGLSVSGASGGGMLGATLLFLLFYIGYYLFFRTRFALASPAVVLEGLGPIAAMRRSWRLVTGDFWRMFGILLLTMLLVQFVGSVLTFPFTVVGTALGTFGAGSAATTVVTAVLLAVGSTVGLMVVYPFEAGVAGLLYADRRMRSEAFDLVLQTAAIEQQRQGWVHASADELWHSDNSARS
ncbi:membrane protein [Nonomuraea fastidiosa]